MPGPFDQIAELLNIGQGGVANTGSIDPLDVLGIGTRGRARYAAETGAANRQQAGFEEAARIRQEQATATERERALAQQLASRYQTLLRTHNGDHNQAVRALMQSSEFSTAFAHGNIDKLISTIKTLSAGPVDPGRAVMDELTVPGIEGPERSPAAIAGNITDAQLPGIQAAARIAPAATATDVATRMRTPPAAPEPTAGQVEEEKQRTRRGVQMLDRVSAEGENAGRVLADVTALEGALSRSGGGTATGLRSLAAQYGLPIEGASDLQLAQAIVGRLGPAQRTPGVGPMSDFETRSLMATIPNAWQTPGGRTLVARQMRVLAEHASERGRIATEFYAGKRTLPDTFAALDAQEQKFLRLIRQLRKAQGTERVQIAPGVTLEPLQ